MGTLDSAEQALDCRILDLTDESGVYGAKLLADMGADVIKIEPRGGDRTRKIGPFFRGEPHPERSLYFMGMNTNKRGVTLDLETSVGREVFKGLTKSADVIIESFPVGYLASLGLGFAELSSINPRLIVTSITAFGQTGPYRHFVGADHVGWAMGGTMCLWGLPDRAPLNAPGAAYSYSGMNAAIGTLAALQGRRKLGTGQHVDISVQESVLAFTTESGVAKYLDDLIQLQRSGNTRSGVAPVGYFRCKDGSVCVIGGGGSPAQWDRFAKWVYDVTGDETVLAEIYRGNVMERWVYAEALNFLTEELTSSGTKQELFEEAMRRDVTVTPVNTVEDLLKDPQLQARNFWVDVNHPETGELRYPGAPYIFSQSPWSIRRPAPRLGQHNEEIYVGELGLSRDVLQAVQPTV